MYEENLFLQFLSRNPSNILQVFESFFLTSKIQMNSSKKIFENTKKFHPDTGQNDFIQATVHR